MSLWSAVSIQSNQFTLMMALSERPAKCRLVESSHIKYRYMSVAVLISTLLEVCWVSEDESVVGGIDTQ
jgi:hypothetical protein